MLLAIQKRLKLLDWGLLTLVFLLVIFALIIQYDLSFTSSASGAYQISNFTKQLIFSLVGFLIVLIISQIDFRFLKSISYIFYALSVVALFGVLFFGRAFHGVRGWASIGFANFQLVELAKLASILALATFWQKTIRPLPFKRIILSLIFVLPPVILVVLQPDLGSALILFFTWLGVILLVDNNWKHVLVIFLIIAVGVVIIYLFFLQDYQRDRIIGYFQPNLDPMGRGYQISQSVLAIGSGGWWGRGLSLSARGSLSFLPAGQTDFILAAIAERAGFLGCIIVFVIFFLIFTRINKLIQKIYDNFATLLLVGILINFVIHFIMNIGMNLGLLPIIGVPVPFLSYGGSYLLISFVFIGLIESISVHRLFISQEKEIL